MAIPNIDKLSYGELLKLRGKVGEAVSVKRAEETQSAKQQLRELAEKRGLNIDELFGKRRARTASAVKYRNPKDASQTWTGRGRKPNWLVEARKKGAKLESFSA